MDYGYNVKVGEGAFINFDCVIIDTCLVTIGARTLFGPKVSLYSGTHPLDPAVRNGTEGPESGKEIHIGEDCWLAGNVTVLPGVTIGKGAVIGAGSVVTKVRSRLLTIPGILCEGQKMVFADKDGCHARMFPRFIWPWETQRE
ncbi:hypothetical protein ABZX51_007575 [Aspergillus tubingensis]